MKTQLAAEEDKTCRGPRPRPDLREEDKKSIETHILSLVTSMIGPWEDKHGGLMATGLILESGVGSSEFSDQVRSTLPILLEETESRVRIAAGTYEISGCGLTIYRFEYFQMVCFDQYMMNGSLFQVFR